MLFILKHRFETFLPNCFQLTSNVLLFLEQLIDYTETVSAILTTQDTSYNQMLLRLQRKISGIVFQKKRLEFNEYVF